MKKMMFLMLTLFFLGLASMNAQVTIGADRVPVTGAVLELDGAKGALLLPKADTLAVTTPVAGMQVYRPGDNKVYVYDGKSWKGAAVGSAAPIITAQPKSFTWSRLKDINGDPDFANASFTPPALTVTASGSDLKYQWYKKATNRNAADTVVATTATYTPPAITAWGMSSYYVVVSNEFGSVTSQIADVATGCGAKTSTGGWLKIQCYNLGADTSKDPFVYASTNDTTSNDIKGWLFQWGRTADGHQWRSSDFIAGPDTLTKQGGVASVGRAGKFISADTITIGSAFDWRYPQAPTLWRNWNDNTSPCAVGWRLPTSDEWGGIFVDGSFYAASTMATANTWSWTPSGYLIRPDGVTETLFLPAAGYRRYDFSDLRNVERYGAYWTSEAVSTLSYLLYFSSNIVSPHAANVRAYGFSVRCVAI